MADSNVYVEGVNSSIIQNLQEAHMTTDDAVKSIDLQLKEIVSNGLKISQSSLQDLLASGVYDRRDAEGRTARRDVFAERRERSQANRITNSSANSNTSRREEQWERDLDTAFNNARPRRRRGSSFDDIMDSWEDEFKRSLFGTVNPLRAALNSSVQGLAQKLGVSTKDLAKEVGARLGAMMGDAFRNNPIGARLSKEWRGIIGGLTRRTSNWFDSLGDRLASVPLDPEAIINSPATETSEQSNNLANVSVETVTQSNNLTHALADAAKGAEISGQALQGASTAGAEVMEANIAAAGSASELTSAVTGASAVFPGLSLAILGAGVALKGLQVALGLLKKVVTWSIAPLKEGISGLLNLIKQAAELPDSKNAKYLELWRKRVAADVESLRKLSYDVIQESAEHIMDVWDSVLTTISATQGYDKAGVQDLWAAYADRLTEMGLASTVSSADIMESLKSILESGLSGEIAEEFAIQSTILKNAVPTQDFTQYASTYASIAANALKNGASQRDAIATANSELYSFASNLLYASREIAGGFTTSLVNGSSLFEQSAKIALTSRTGDISDISGILTSVSAIVGATAPDLADTLVTAVVEAATGGNSSNLTALRSMAGAGASNTAFLQALANDPKDIFETLFRNLAQLQNMSAANYMEVAEGLSEVFGLSMDAFARVDFDYLADAIHSMALTNNSLEENLKMLASGETTSNASQLRMQKINEYMIEEGLAYVLDNEAAREVQRHMWEEQLARELMDSTYAIDFAGSAFTAIQNILSSIRRVTSLLDGSLIDNIRSSIKLTAVEMSVQQEEIKEVVAAGVVGSGNAKAFSNLTTGFTDLNLAKSYVDLLTGQDKYSKVYDFLADRAEQERINNGSFYDTLLGQAGLSQNELLQELVGAGGKIATRELVTELWEETHPHSSGGHRFASTIEDLSTHASGGHQFGDSSKATQQSSNSKQKYRSSSPGSLYNFSLVSKSIGTQAARTAWAAESAYNKAADAVTYRVETASDDFDAFTKKNLTDYVKNSNSLTTSITSSVQAEGELHRGFLTQSEIAEKLATAQEANLDSASSFSDWVQRLEEKWNNEAIAEKSRQGHYVTPEEAQREYRTIEEILEDYNADISQLEALYLQEQTAQTSAANKARELHEVQFWEDMQNFATKDFPDYMLDFKEYMKNWADYYIRHTAYGNETAGAYVDEKGKPITGEAFTDSSSIGSLMMASEQGQGDAILALAQMLTDNATYQNKSLEQLKDPTLQTNAILSKLLLVVEAIYQQNNNTSIVSIPQSLSALGLGVTNI